MKNLEETYFGLLQCNPFAVKESYLKFDAITIREASVDNDLSGHLDVVAYQEYTW